MSQAAARIGDKDTKHDCGVPTRAEGVKKVFVNGIAWSCLGHKNTVHMINSKDPCDKPHVGVIAKGSKTVFVEGIAAGRLGDKVQKCGSVAQGSDNVFCG
jgi:uncharacterized Zn-binding protein involved in type VI secretion